MYQIVPVTLAIETGKRVLLEGGQHRVPARATNGRELDGVDVDVNRVRVDAAERVFDDAAHRHFEDAVFRLILFAVEEELRDGPRRDYFIHGDVATDDDVFWGFHRIPDVAWPVESKWDGFQRGSRGWLHIEACNRHTAKDVFAMFLADTAEGRNSVCLGQTIVRGVVRVEVVRDCRPVVLPWPCAPENNLRAATDEEWQHAKFARNGAREEVAILGKQAPLACRVVGLPRCLAFDHRVHTEHRRSCENAETGPNVLLHGDLRPKRAVH
mmetsp:Transcript_7626/g.22290  ORF Transcript_7626/g.22290 Transcript_7626/m.22290 type:complete len:269 (-) Transcript_7626:879-1685(-)